MDSNLKIMSVDLLGAGSKGSSSKWWKSLNEIVNECTSIKTGPIEDLIINKGGIQNRISKESKEKFKTEVSLYLTAYTDTVEPITGRIEGNLAEGILKDATLHFQCKKEHKITPPF